MPQFWLTGFALPQPRLCGGSAQTGRQRFGSGGPTLISALESQLGLKLESKKGPVKVLVVDSMNKKPTEN